MAIISSLAENIRIILMFPSHPGNIGAAARAMKTMGLSNLYLVKPKFFPHKGATERAAQAADVLARAVVVDSLEEAIANCKIILGTTTRVRALPWPTLNARAAGERVVSEAQQHAVAVLFGNERTGLLNEDIQHCHFQIEIPSNPNCNALNLAAAVQVIAYEIYMAMLGPIESLREMRDELANPVELEGFYEHFKQVLIASEFLDPQQPKQVLARLRRLFNRARLDKTELNILRGIFTAILRKFSS